MKQMNNP